MNNNKKMKKHQ